jgi:hypothetical protein
MPSGQTIDLLESTAHEVVPHAISVLQGHGYNLVTLAECLGEEPYQSVTTPENVSQPSFPSPLVAC